MIASTLCLAGGNQVKAGRDSRVAPAVVLSSGKCDDRSSVGRRILPTAHELAVASKGNTKICTRGYMADVRTVHDLPDAVVGPSVRPSICPSVRSSVHPCVRPSFHSFVPSSTRQIVRLFSSSRPSVRSFVRSSVRSFVNLSIRLSVRAFVRPSVRPFVRPSAVHSYVHTSDRSSARQSVNTSIGTCRSV